MNENLFSLFTYYITIAGKRCQDNSAFFWWGEQELNLHSLRRLIYSQLGSPLAQSPRILVGVIGIEPMTFCV